MTAPLPSREEAGAELARYTTRTTKIERAAPYWETLRVEILRDGEVIGAYDRNYPAFYTTFLPFIGPDGRTYALYSREYTATRVMRLPECKDLGGEEPASMGFCPVEFLVPYDPERGLDGSLGFVAGCVWGDDSSWKVQFLDLLGVAQGRIVRDERFGYLELAGNISLAEAVDVSHWDLSNRSLRIHAAPRFEIPLREGELDRSIIVDERPAEPGLTAPEPLLAGPFDSFHAQFFDARHNWLTSQPLPTFAAAFAVALRWARERDQQLRVWGVAEDRSTLLCNIEPDGGFELRKS